MAESPTCRITQNFESLIYIKYFESANYESPFPDSPTFESPTPKSPRYIQTCWIPTFESPAPKSPVFLQDGLFWSGGFDTNNSWALRVGSCLLTYHIWNICPFDFVVCWKFQDWNFPMNLAMYSLNIDPVQTYHFSEYIIIQCNGACAEMYLLGRWNWPCFRRGAGGSMDFSMWG